MENSSSQVKNTQNKKDFKGFLLAFGAVFFWSFNVIFAHILKTELTPIQIAFFRWLIAALAFLPFTAEKIWKSRTLLLNNWKIVLILSFFGIALSNTFVYQASYTSTAVDMALIGTSGPIFLIFFARVFLGISVSRNQILGILCALAGVVTIITDGSLKQLEDFRFAVGDFWMLGTAVTFGFYGAMQEKIKPLNIPAFALLPATIILATLMLLPFFLLSLENAPLTSVTPTGWKIILFLGVGNSAVAYIAWNISIRIIGSLKSSIIYYLMPVLSTIEAYFILGEQIAPAQMYGGLLVLTGIILTTVHSKHHFTLHRT